MLVLIFKVSYPSQTTYIIVYKMSLGMKASFLKIYIITFFKGDSCLKKVGQSKTLSYNFAARNMQQTVSHHEILNLYLGFRALIMDFNWWVQGPFIGIKQM